MPSPQLSEGRSPSRAQLYEMANTKMVKAIRQSGTSEEFDLGGYNQESTTQLMKVGRGEGTGHARRSGVAAGEGFPQRAAAAHPHLGVSTGV